MKFEMSILLRPEMALQDTKDRCPRCHHINLNATVDRGWIQWKVLITSKHTYDWHYLCSRKCFGQFQIVDASPNHLEKESATGDGVNEHVDEEHCREDNGENGDDDLVSPAS